LTTLSELIHTIVLHQQQRKSVLCTQRGIVAKFIGHSASVVVLAVLLVAVPGGAQEPTAPLADDAAPVQAQAGQQTLDLQDAIARDVLEPLQAGMQSRNLKQVLSVFDAQSAPSFPQLQERMKALLDAFASVQFRYKILQAGSEKGHASMTCEVDLDGIPLDSGQVPIRRSAQVRLQLTQTAQGWRISSYSPSDFFNP
jgi:hypothetical protein